MEDEEKEEKSFREKMALFRLHQNLGSLSGCEIEELEDCVKNEAAWRKQQEQFKDSEDYSPEEPSESDVKIPIVENPERPEE